MFVFKTIIWGTLFLFGALIIGPWLSLHFDESFPQIGLGPFRYLGFLMFAVGLSIALYCTFIIFLPLQGRPAPYDADGAFVIKGPYKYVRNPFFLGMLLALWGEAFIMSRSSMIIYSIIFTWVIHFWVVFYEEPSLEERFGEEYLTYKRAIPRWLPRFKRYEQ